MNEAESLVRGNSFRCCARVMESRPFGRAAKAEIHLLGRPKLSVIIVNYNAGALLADSVGALLTSALSIEILISDNGSVDQSLSLVRRRYGQDPRLSIIENRKNLGFARGNNLALIHSRAPYLLFLNPDCIVGRNTLDSLVAFMDRTPDAGLVGCVVRNPDGSEQVATRRPIPDPGTGLFGLLRVDGIWPRMSGGRWTGRIAEPLPDAPVEVEAVSGALMLVRRTALDQVGPFDEGYFLHCEDLDWFVRFARAGWKIYLVPDAEVVHHKGVCSAHRPLWVEWHKHRGMVRFYRKFQFRSHPLLLSVAVVLGIWLRFGLVSLGIALRWLCLPAGR